MSTASRPLSTWDLLPDAEKRDLCITLLEEFGVTHISETVKGELRHRCVLPLGGHSDRNSITASINYRSLLVNCWVCKNAGSLFWFVAVMRGLSIDASRAAVEQITGVSEIPELPMLRLMVDEIMTGGSRNKRLPMPTFNEGFLDQWTRWPRFHPLLTLPTSEGGRAIREETLVKHRVGYCDHDDVWKYYQRAIFPMWWDGKLVGWQARRLNPFEDPITAKYLNSPDLPRDRMVYGLPAGPVVVVVESLMSKLRHDHHLPIAATLGAQVTDDQLESLHRYSKVIWFPDNDDGGVTGLKGTRHSPGVLEKLKAHTDVYVVKNDYLASISPVVGADPGDMEDDLVDEMVNAAVPHELWRPPTVVESRPLPRGMAAA